VGFNQPGYRGEEFLEGRGNVSLVDWTPNALAFEIDSPERTVLVVNQNYDPAWTLARGEGEVFSDGGRIGVRIPAGSEQIVLRYRSRAFEWGVVLLVIGLAAIGWLAVRARRSRPDAP
jgi:uncharacterized membrane protein YfhO